MFLEGLLGSRCAQWGMWPRRKGEEEEEEEEEAKVGVREKENMETRNGVMREGEKKQKRATLQQIRELVQGEGSKADGG
ncbi:hypothetical protein E2C01_097428 [Portunus trituberculatus]|uniref:Uncharacterized protein n=1 Tax=Portunus trituberculatus TaxID=210409 RepID=A0A5B7K4F6_PORTR|nr:hypothetical protein [Portunus trituberculatus]